MPQIVKTWEVIGLIVHQNLLASLKHLLQQSAFHSASPLSFRYSTSNLTRLYPSHCSTTDNTHPALAVGTNLVAILCHWITGQDRCWSMKQCSERCSVAWQRMVWEGAQLIADTRVGTRFFFECSLHSFIYRGIIPRLPYLHDSELPLKSKIQSQEATQCVPSYKDPL